MNRTVLSTAGYQDVQPTEASARREFTRFCEADSAGKCRLILHYFYKRPKLGMAVRRLLKARETALRAADRAARSHHRRRDDQAAAAEMLDGDEVEALHQALALNDLAGAAMLVDADPLQPLVGDDAPFFGTGGR